MDMCVFYIDDDVFFVYLVRCNLGCFNYDVIYVYDVD